MTDGILDADRTQALAEHLKRIPRVVESARRNGATADSEAWQIATGLSDIQESTDRLFKKLIPALLSVGPASEEADELMNEVGEEYRHILYHIRDTKLFAYVAGGE
jgi:ABC-type uncharacterized transport system substrate-binding protein